MKRLIFILIIFLISGCSVERKDFYNLSIDEYKIVVGYDGYEYLNSVFKLNKNELTLLDKHFANFEYGIIDKKEVITYLEFYTKDFGSIYRIDEIELSKSIKQNCDAFNGDYIDKKTKGCIIQKQVGNYTNAIILSGDILDDKLDHMNKIEVYIK